MQSVSDRGALTLAIRLSVIVGAGMLVLKVAAWRLTNSSAILSDAAESVVHIFAVVFAAWSLRLSFKPADAEHPYGHAKVGFFSAGFEGAMIVIAALFIIWDATEKLIRGVEIQQLGLGTAMTAVAGAVNGALGAYLLVIGRRNNSIVLEANGKHVLTDCWTSVGVVVGLLLALFTGWLYWDPIFALLVATNILVSGVVLMRRSVGGLMDAADPEVQRNLEQLLAHETERQGIRFHDLRHRDSGNGHWVDVHLLFPDTMTVQEAHRIATEIERAIESTLEPGAHVTTHLEPEEDHAVMHPAEPGG